VKKPGEENVAPGDQTDHPLLGKNGAFRVVVACLISQNEGTEKSASLFVSEVCRA